jgi:CheY-like chemotaxis protein
LYQVFNNVLSNAVKFTGAGGRIELRCDADDHWLRIAIRDSGQGIPPEFLPHVFDRFRQADSRATRVHGGLGLGLAIAKHLVDLHGGEIEADSRGSGTGTLVSIRLPVADAPRSNEGIDAQPQPAAKPSPLLDATLLVVDDEPDSREMIAALLEHRGAVIVRCDSAAAALDLLSRQTVDLLIADIAMPHMDGYELMRRARTSGFQVPGIAVTAFARSDDRRLAFDAGYTSYLVKPVDGVQLARTVDELLQMRRAG